MVYARPAQDGVRVGFVVSKAVGGAVRRNRVKRRLRHIVRPLVGEFGGATIVVRALPPAATAGGRLAGDVTTTLRRACERAGVGVTA